MKDFKFAVIGGGFMGRAYSIALSSFTSYVWPTSLNPVKELIVEVNDDLAAESQKRFGFNRRGTDWRAAVRDPDVDAVCILLPNAMHHEVVLAAIDAGKHIICEKPLALTVEHAKEMADRADAAGVVNQVGFNWRMAPAIQLAHKLIAEGAIGDVRNVHSYWLGEFFNDPSVPLLWRFQKDQAGTGALGDVASHAIDFAQFLAGDITRVIGQQQQFIETRPLLDGSGVGRVEVDDATSFLVEFASGAQGYVNGSWAAPGNKSHGGFDVTGSTGSISFDWGRMNELRFYDGSDAVDRQGFRTIVLGPDHPFGEHFWPIAGYQIGYGETKVIQLLDFLRAVSGETDGPQATFRQGLEVALVENAVLTSVRTGQWEAVDNAKVES